MEPRWAASGSTSSGRAAIPTARPTESPSICAWNRAVDGENSPLQYDSSWLTSSAWLPPKDLGDSLSASSRTDRSIRQSSGSSRRTVAAIGPLCQSGPLRQPLTRDPSRCPAKERPRCARGRARDVDLGRTRATCAPRLGALRIRSPAQDDLRSSVEHARPWPGGHTDAPVTQESRTLRTPGPRMIATTAGPGYVSRPRATPPGPPGSWKPRIAGRAESPDARRHRATNDRRPGGTSERLPPAGHKRPRARRNLRTGSRPRATNDRRPGGTSERLAPPGHERTRSSTPGANGPMMTVSGSGRGEGPGGFIDSALPRSAPHRAA